MNANVLLSGDHRGQLVTPWLFPQNQRMGGAVAAGKVELGETRGFGSPLAATCVGCDQPAPSRWTTNMRALLTEPSSQASAVPSGLTAGHCGAPPRLVPQYDVSPPMPVMGRASLPSGFDDQIRMSRFCV